MEDGLGCESNETAGPETQDSAGRESKGRALLDTVSIPGQSINSRPPTEGLRLVVVVCAFQIWRFSNPVGLCMPDVARWVSAHSSRTRVEGVTGLALS